ncbi:hypothetical protein AM588_10000496 [Phytophthora nicotianae]|uniref:Uncharacterized protein n=1 Tax=Phytophthora nicotianae TaxID=4792 RepID=A0A0W8CGB9_PHYNI|nr:hypothetical protein AM588_10000496 [Phytophthora nicotianae]
MLSLVVAFQVASGLEYTDTGVAIVGTTEPLDVNVTAGTSREDLISYEFASYIAVHFAGFNLPEGDSVVISSPDANVTVSHTYTNRGRDQTGTFIASFIPGNSVAVMYTSVGTASAGQGYRITGFSRGYPTMQHESVCGDGDQSLPAKCYAPGTNLSESLPEAYTKAQSVARLLINGTYLCTGWLGGSEGHLFTNHHCFEQEEWALTTDIEFAAESSSCSDQCETQLGCPGTLVATTSTLIADDEDIDYAVVQLPDCVDLSPYGYLQLLGIHHCGGCANTAIDVRTVLADLASKNITIKNLVASDVGQHSQPAYAQAPCAAQNPTHSAQNHTTPCHRSSNASLTTTTSNSTSTVTVTSNVTTSNSLTITTSSTPTSSPLATVPASTAGSQSTPSPSTATTTASTVTTKTTAALTSASVVTSTKSTSWALSDNDDSSGHCNVGQFHLKYDYGHK